MTITQSDLDSEIETQLPTGSVQGISSSTLRTILHGMVAAIFQGASGFFGLASPSGTTGLTVVNGSSNTAMRSDASPALDQGIAPVWTNKHTFSQNTPSTSPSTGSAVISGNGGLGVGGAVNAGGAIGSGTIGGPNGTINLIGATSGLAVITATSTGGLVVNGSSVQGAQRVAATVTAVANNDFSLNIPPGSTVLGVTSYTTTPFTGTTVTLQAGSTVGGSDYASPVSIKAAGVVSLLLSGAAQGNLPVGTPNYFMRIVQTGPTAVGAAVIIVDYLLP